MTKIQFSFLQIISIFCLTLFLVTACSESDCSITNRPACRFVFVETETGEELALTDTITVTALDTDSILLNRATRMTYISLPLSYTSSVTTFIIQYHNRGYRDTIALYHTNIPHFISMDCGRDMFFHIDDIYRSTNILDDAIVTNPDIRDHEKENVKIYYSADQ